MDLLSVKDVLARTGMHRSMLSRLRETGKFPRHIHLGPRYVAWPSYAIDEWCKANPPYRKGHRD